MNTLTDQSQFPFGKYKGYLLEKVPADYLLWLWDNGLYDRDQVQLECDYGPHEKRGHAKQRLRVHDYIHANFHALETECPDRVITHKP